MYGVGTLASASAAKIVVIPSLVGLVINLVSVRVNRLIMLFITVTDVGKYLPRQRRQSLFRRTKVKPKSLPLEARGPTADRPRP